MPIHRRRSANFRPASAAVAAPSGTQCAASRTRGARNTSIAAVLRTRTDVLCVRADHQRDVDDIYKYIRVATFFYINPSSCSKRRVGVGVCVIRDGGRARACEAKKSFGRQKTRSELFNPTFVFIDSPSNSSRSSCRRIQIRHRFSQLKILLNTKSISAMFRFNNAIRRQIYFIF